MSNCASPMLELTQIKSEVENLAAKIKASGSILPTYGRSEDFARPHIEVDARGYHFVVVERGQELERHTTHNLDELLYRIFEGVFFSLATQFELAHRVQAQDFRRVLFRHQIELLSKLSPNWAELELRCHEKILKEYPFDDRSGIRVELTKDLRSQGHSPEIAWKLACETYPLPAPAQ